MTHIPNVSNFLVSHPWYESLTAKNYSFTTDFLQSLKTIINSLADPSPKATQRKRNQIINGEDGYFYETIRSQKYRLAIVFAGLPLTIQLAI